MSRRLLRLSVRFVAAAALLGCLVSALPFGGQVHAGSTPVSTGVIPLTHHITLSHATFVGPPGATITVGANGAVTVSGTTQSVHVIPSKGYVLATFNPSTGQWEQVRNSTIVPGEGPYSLISVTGVPHITGLSTQLSGVRGGRTAACRPAHDRKGHVLPGCQIVTAAAPPRSKLTFTVTYAGHPKLTQHFVVTVDAHGRYHGAFPVLYKPPAGSKHGVPVTVTVVDTLPDGAYGGTKTYKFVDMPAPRRPPSHTAKKK